MSTALQSLINNYSDLLIQALELGDKDILGDVLVSIADTDALIDQGLLR